MKLMTYYIRAITFFLQKLLCEKKFCCLVPVNSEKNL